jgi:hypothetical protein
MTSGSLKPIVTPIVVAAASSVLGVLIAVCVGIAYD